MIWNLTDTPRQRPTPAEKHGAAMARAGSRLLSIEFLPMQPSDSLSRAATDWRAELAASGAAVDANRVLHFGDPAAELLAARDGIVVCDLSHLGMIAATGADADTFLQGQLSSDLRQLDPHHAQYSSYNTPKGRMLASLLVYRAAAAVRLQLPRELVEPIRKRLAMFILRSKVALVDASDSYLRFGVAGKGAEALVTSTVGGAPAAALEVFQADAAIAIRLPGDRFEIVADCDARGAPLAGAWRVRARRRGPRSGIGWRSGRASRSSPRPPRRRSYRRWSTSSSWVA